MTKMTTKDRLLHQLKKDYELSMKELMTYFSISEVAVRKQLQDLIRQGLIRKREVKAEIGRPMLIYALTDKGHHTFPNQYKVLPSELLADLEVSLGKKAVHQLLRERKDREERELQFHMEDASFPEKVEKLIDYQEEKGYMIEIETKETGDIELKNFNCPIYHLASNYQIICTNEKEMYRSLFPESEITSSSCMTKGGKYCCWQITNPAGEEIER